MTDGALFTNDDLLGDAIAALEARLDAVSARYDDYHPDCARRAVYDERRSARDRIAGARKYLDGTFDGTYPGYRGSLEDYRADYAQNAVRRAESHVVWAEHFAGLRTREEAFAADPLRQ